MSVEDCAMMATVLKKVGLGSKNKQTGVTDHGGDERDGVCRNVRVCDLVKVCARPADSMRSRNRRQRSRTTQRPTSGHMTLLRSLQLRIDLWTTCTGNLLDRSFARRFCGRKSDNQLYRSNSFRFEKFERQEDTTNQVSLCDDYSVPVDFVNKRRSKTLDWRSSAPRTNQVQVVDEYFDPRDSKSYKEPPPIRREKLHTSAKPSKHRRRSNRVDGSLDSTFRGYENNIRVTVFHPGSDDEEQRVEVIERRPSPYYYSDLLNHDDSGPSAFKSYRKPDEARSSTGTASTTYYCKANDKPGLESYRPFSAKENLEPKQGGIGFYDFASGKSRKKHRVVEVKKKKPPETVVEKTEDAQETDVGRQAELDVRLRDVSSGARRREYVKSASLDVPSLEKSPTKKKGCRKSASLDIPLGEKNSQNVGESCNRFRPIVPVKELEEGVEGGDEGEEEVKREKRKSLKKATRQVSNYNYNYRDCLTGAPKKQCPKCPKCPKNEFSPADILQHVIHSGADSKSLLAACLAEWDAHTRLMRPLTARTLTQCACATGAQTQCFSSDEEDEGYTRDPAPLEFVSRGESFKRRQESYKRRQFLKEPIPEGQHLGDEFLQGKKVSESENLEGRKKDKNKKGLNAAEIYQNWGIVVEDEGGFENWNQGYDDNSDSAEAYRIAKEIIKETENWVSKKSLEETEKSSSRKSLQLIENSSSRKSLLQTENSSSRKSLEQTDKSSSRKSLDQTEDCSSKESVGQTEKRTGKSSWRSSDSLYDFEDMSRKGLLYETAFDCKVSKSDDDLDEVDRVTNHPVLHSRIGRSRSAAPATLIENYSKPPRPGSSFRSVNILTDRKPSPEEDKPKPVDAVDSVADKLQAVAIADNPTPPSTAPLPSKFCGHEEYVMNSIKSAPELPITSPAHLRLKDTRLPVKSLRARDNRPKPEEKTGEGTAPSPKQDSQDAPADVNMTKPASLVQKDGLILEFKGRPQVKKITTRPRSLIGEIRPLLELKSHQRRPGRFRFSSTESMATSSSGGSLESIKSSTSEGNRSTSSSESHRSSSLSSHSSDSVGLTITAANLQYHLQQNNQHHHTNKMHILSPISDKSSVGPVSETSDNNKNNNSQKSSPEDTKEVKEVKLSKRRILQNKNLINLGLTTTGDAAQASDSGISIDSTARSAPNRGQTETDFSDLPFDMPKLRRRRVVEPDSGTGRRASAHADVDACTSGSTTSVDLRDLPFDMPKLRRRTRAPMLSEASSSQSVADQAPGVLFRPSMTLSLDLDSSSSPGRGLSLELDRTRTHGLGTMTLGTFSGADLIDPSLPLEKQSWYHGTITRVEAEGVLRSLKEGSYLVRNSESARQDYSLSLKSARGFMHMRIQKDSANSKYILGEFSKPFDTIPGMIRHYSINRLPIRGAEHMCLLKPVTAQLL